MSFVVLALAILTQLVLNFFRISSQGANGPFVRYKGNMGTSTQFTDQLETKTRSSIYTAKDVFDLQFPQYNSIITALKDRANEDGIVVAGTYLQYFLENQWNLKGDGLLTDFRVKASDGNLCKTYHRLKNDHIKYLVIDPNIGTVGMGEGNETLFHRFFAKLNPVNGKVEQDGTLTTLVKMAQLGYLKLISTNNVGAYYAFNLNDADISVAFGVTTPEEIVLTRAKLIGIRYFPEESNTLFNQIANVFLQRIMAGVGFEEIASVYGLEIDTQKVARVAVQVSQKNTEGIAELTQNERTVLIQYLNLFQAFSSSNTQIQNQGQQMLQNILMTSVTNSSQVMLFELI
ncbi:MAG: hypothetical protein LBD11_08800 [Candidatus Peribacteria bacterium]|nr:hypothetical protein [Candidatus Peribacteria bacterium]